MFRFVLAVALGLSIVPAAAQPGRLHDQSRLMDTVEELSSDKLEGRAVGSKGSMLAREIIIDRFERAGVLPMGASYTVPFTVKTDGKLGTLLSGTNVVGYLEGLETGGDGPYIVVTAHYDHEGIKDGKIYNGADDNASGVAAMLEVAEYFGMRPPMHDVIFVAFDAEERGLLGAKAFLESPPVPVSRIALNINLDMVARADKGELYAVGTYHFPFLTPFVDAVAASAPMTLKRGHDRPEDGDQDWTYLSDQGRFITAGIPAVYIGVEDHADYHQPTDDFERIDAGTFSRSVDTIILLASRLDGVLGEIVAATTAAPSNKGTEGK